MLAAPLSALGRSEIITSLFDPLLVDRNHWSSLGWQPIETGTQAVRSALRGKPTQPPLLLYVTNSTPYFFSHRIAFAREAARRGFRIALAGGDVDDYRERIEAEGILPLTIPGGARGVDPIGDLRAGLAISAHIRQLDVQVVHASGLKAIFLCALARLGGPLPRTVCIVTGLGLTYTEDSIRSRLMQRVIEAALRPLLHHPQTTTVFQNRDDRAQFLERGIARMENSLTIKGSGVDIHEYDQVTEPAEGPPLVVFPARLLKSKGALVFAQAASILKSRGVNARFALVGDLDTANPDSLTQDELSDLVRSGSVETWGFRTDMAKVLAESHLVCLPSYYREGVPKALIEAASIGRAIVTADAPGCREIVRHEENGLLVPPRDAVALASALERLIRDPDLRCRMGAAGRSIVEAEFSMGVVLSATVNLYGRPSQAANELTSAATELLGRDLVA
jgi:glycosyltransferase involved in cell wall biosynthesis